MSEKKVAVNLEKEMTWAGKNYPLGLNELPEAAAKSAVKRKFGMLADGSAPPADLPDDFEPLSYEDTFRRFGEGDASSEVFESLKFYQPMIKAAKDAKMSVEDYIEQQKAARDKSEQSEGLPEDFPMRHVFARLGEKFDTVEKIQAMSETDLIAVDGIAEASAKKALTYGK